MESRNFNFSSLANLVRDNIRLFLIVGIVAAVAGFIISMPVFMPPKFKSVAVVYPINIEAYSDESETEQLLQYFESTSIRDSLISKFDLYSRFSIDPNAKGARYYMNLEYIDRVVVSKTLYESVRLEVSDEDPEIAKAMADEVLNQVNAKFNAMINEWGQSKANSYELQMDYQRKVIDTLESTISQMSTDNRILDYGSQTRELVRGYIDLSVKGSNSPLFKDVESWLKSAQEKGSTVKMLQNLSYFASNQLGLLEQEYLFWREKAYSDIEYLQVIVSPEVSDKKSWPVRWLILVVSVFSALLVTGVVLSFSKVH